MNGTPFVKRAYNLGLKAVPNFVGLSEEVVAYYEQHLDQIPSALARGFVLEETKAAPKPPPLFSVLATTNLAAIGGKKTAECFSNRTRYCHRDADFDNWLSASQPNTGACAVTTLALSKAWLFAEAARALPGIEQTSGIAALGRSLIVCGYVMTLAQAEEMVEATERGENTGLRTDGWGNFFFVETGDSKDPVSVGSVGRGGRDWDAYLDRLGRSRCWSAGGRLLVRNLDASKLGL